MMARVGYEAEQSGRKSWDKIKLVRDMVEIWKERSYHTFWEAALHTSNYTRGWGEE